MTIIVRTFLTLLLLFSSCQWVASQSDVDLSSCTPVTDRSYSIQLVNVGGVTEERFVDAFTKAAERWEKVIVGDLPDFPAGSVNDWFQGFFAGASYQGAVDDLVIGYEITEIDGPGGTLGSAGPVFTRRDRNNRPMGTISGVMRFDAQDFARMPDGDIKAVVLHEMGHVLGLVGTTGVCTGACNARDSDTNFPYTCPLASAEYSAWAPSTLILENSGGQGTACGHWDESAFRTSQSSELMTGFFEANLLQPLSRVTVAAVEDLGGYTVDYCGADIWPATPETQQRFEVYRTLQNMDMTEDGGMDRQPVVTIGIGPDGEIIMDDEGTQGLEPMSDTSSASRHHYYSIVIAIVALQMFFLFY